MTEYISIQWTHVCKVQKDAVAAERKVAGVARSGTHQDFRSPPGRVAEAASSRVKCSSSSLHVLFNQVNCHPTPRYTKSELLKKKVMMIFIVNFLRDLLL